ncbi:MAG TPA: histidinol-phosphate transaminase, partial [Anaerolineae bacterium]|nr:histidinol-phosphate transaminase [Anaerolineae bacterium]
DFTRGYLQMDDLIRPHIAGIEPYVPPDLSGMAHLAGVRVEELIRLDSNENPYGPSTRAAQAVAEFTEYGFYPDYGELQKAVAVYAGVEAGQVALGNGADELIDLVMRLVLEPGQSLITCPPAFGMYGFFAALGRHPVRTVPLGEDFSVDVASIESLMQGQGNGPQPRLIFLTSPGNPDGQIVPVDTICRLLQLPLVVVLDEAYIEFAGQFVEPSAVELLPQYENLIILRTFSKWAGLAGLRLGYALSSRSLADGLGRIRAPYNVNSAVMVAGLATLADLGSVQANVARVISERKRLQRELSALPWIDPLPSQANFILCGVSGCSGQEVADWLARQGILVRSYSTPGLQGYVRITVGRPQQNDKLIEALQGMSRSGA